MQGSFNQAANFVLQWEEYISNIPGDKGGLTIWGIASAFWPKDVEKMKNMSKEDSFAYAKEFYKREYWNPCSCDDLSYPLDVIVMDTAVNCGVGRAKSFLKETPNWMDYLMMRIKFYVDSTQEQFDDGWINRIVQTNPKKLGLYWTIKGSADNEHPLSI